MPFVSFLGPPRRGPLRRGTDVAEFWLVWVTAVLAVAVAPAAGLAAANAVADGARQEIREQRSVAAVLTESPPARIGVDAAISVGGQVHATVRWTASDGTVREGRTAVAPGAQAGDRTTAWLDGRGALLADPVTPSQAGAGSIAVGTVAGAAGCLALIGAGRAGHLLLMRRRYARWDREWAAADPGWGQRAA